MLVTPPFGASSNIALWRAYSKPPVELVVADLAESNEFRLARFYHVCEEVCLVLLGSPLIVCGFVGHIRGLFKRGKDTE